MRIHKLAIVLFLGIVSCGGGGGGGETLPATIGNFPHGIPTALSNARFALGVDTANTKVLAKSVGACR